MPSIRHALAAAAVTAALGLAGQAAAANLLANGDFEAGGGSTAGWTISTSGAGWILLATAHTYQPCCGTFGSEPNYSHNHFAAFGAGNVTGGQAVSQTINTIAGAHYNLTFDLGAFGAGTNTVWASGGGVTNSYLVSADNNADTTFHPFGFSFVGTGGPQTVSFLVNSVSDNTDAILDNVSLTTTSVPEPASWAMMLSGFLGLGAMLRRRRMVTA